MLSIVALVVTCLCLTHVWIARIKPYRDDARQYLETELQRMRDSGYPVTVPELYEWYALPEGAENGAPAYQLAFDAYFHDDREELSASDRELLPILGDFELGAGEPLPEPNLAALRDYLSANEEARVQLKVAAEYEFVRFPLRFEDGMKMAIPHTASIKHASKLLAMEALYQAAVGDIRGAESALINAFAVPRALKSEPVSISQLTRRASTGIAIEALEDLFLRFSISEVALHAIITHLSSSSGREILRHAYIAEAVVVNLQLDHIANGSTNPFYGIFTPEVPGPWAAFNVNLALNYLRLLRTLDMTKAEFLYFLNGMIELSQFNWADSRPVWAEWETYLDDVPPENKILTRFLYPSLVRIRSVAQQHDAKVALSMLACAVELYRHEHAKLPDELSALVPSFLAELPEDPYGDGGIKYERLSDGYKLYSVSRDGEDDGGKSPGPSRELDDTLDLVLTVKRQDLLAHP